jgi:hypothetical protein
MVPKPGVERLYVDRLSCRPLSVHSSSAGAVAIEPLHTVEHALHIGPAGADAVTYRLWQLDLIFQANGRRLVQALGANGPIITQQLPARNQQSPYRCCLSAIRTW